MNCLTISNSIQPGLLARTVSSEEMAARFIEAKRIMGHLAHGIMTVDQEGCISELYLAKKSSPFSPWTSKVGLNGPESTERERTSAASVLFAGDERASSAFDLNLMQLTDDFLPSEVVLAQMPDTAERDGVRYRLLYHVDRLGDAYHQLVVALHEASDELSEAEIAQENAEFRKVAETLLKNVDASRGFFVDTQWLMAEIREKRGDEVTLRRNLHTLKGNLAVFGFDSMAEIVHQAEDQFQASETELYEESLRLLRLTWESKRQTFGDLLESKAHREVVVSREEYEELVMYLMAQMDPAETLGLVQKWSMDPVSRVFARLEMQVRHMASRMGLEVEVSLEHNNVRLPSTGMEVLWASLVHGVRNALDHGIESREERRAQGKSDNAHLTFRAEMSDDVLTVDLEDDGRGIDWSKVRKKAQERGMPAKSQADLVAALLSDGLSTAESVSLTSGRGVGTSAIAGAASTLGGKTELISPVPGETCGTRVRVTVPLASLATMGLVA